MGAIWVTINDDDLKHAGDAADFLQGEFGAPDADPVWSAAYLRWKLGPASPAGSGYVSLAMVDDQVVGIVSLTKKRLLIDGKETIGGEVGDTYSSARVRRSVQPADLSPLNSDPQHFINRSIFGRLASDVRARAEADGISIIYGTPNHNAYPGWTKRLGYFELQSYGNQSFSRPTWRMVLKKYPFIAFAGTCLRIADNGLIASHAWLWRIVARGFILDQNPPSEDEIEKLWNRTKPAMGFSLIRDAAYWRHRYDLHPLAEYSLFGIRFKGDLVSVIAVRLASIAGGKPVLSIVEWMMEERVPFGYVLAQLIHACKDWKIETINLWANASGMEAKAARRSFFSARARVPIIFADTLQGQRLGKAAGGFLFFLGSSDAA